MPTADRPPPEGGVDRVRLEGVVALLGTFPALSGFSLQVTSPQVVVLRGPNGAGKSTVLNVCSGLLSVQRGVVEILGSNVRADRFSVRRHLGYLGHSTGLYNDLTVAQNVTLAARAGGVAPKLVGARVNEVLAQLQLDGRLAKVGINHLSAGQRRRVAISALMVRDVSLWLLDEPHAALDADGRDLLDDVISKARDAGTTVLIASHDWNRVDRLADRVVTVVGGRVADDREVARVA